MSKAVFAHGIVLLVCFAVAIDASRSLHAADQTDQGTDRTISLDKKHKKRMFNSPEGIFIQERASKQLPGPGQHFSFGALKPWDDILSMITEDSKLVFLVRHGQAISNYLSDTLGPDIWFDVEETCEYHETTENGTTWKIFDAELTDLGEQQASSLNSILNGGGWFAKLTGGKPTRAVVSPLSRCLTTSQLVLEGLPISGGVKVEELCRETLGEDTCDARRSVSDPDQTHPEKLVGPCSFERGLASKYPNYTFPIVSASTVNRDFGMTSDADLLWTKEREKQKDQVDRATEFLQVLFNNVPEQVVFVITHSGFTRSVLLAVGREPYRPVNAELVPVIIQKRAPRNDRDEMDA